MKKDNPFILPVFLTISSFFLRLSLITKGAFHFDCLLLLMQSEKSVLDHKIHFAHTHGYPLLSILGAAFVALSKMMRFDDPVIGIHLISIVFGSLCILVNYLLVKKLFDDLAATISSLILSLSPIFLSTTVYGNSHAPFLFFLLLGILMLITYQETHLKRYLIYGSLSLGFAGASRIQDLLLMAIPLCLLIFLEPTCKNKESSFSFKKWKDLLAIGIIALAVILLFYFPILKQKFDVNSSNQVASLIKQEIGGYFYGLGPLKFTSSYLFLNFSPIGYFLLPIALGFLLFEKKFKLFTVLITWIVLPLSLYTTMGYLVPRYLIISIIPLTITLGYFLSRGILSNVFLRSIAAIAFILIAYQGTTFVLPILQERHQKAITPNYVRWFAKNTEKNAHVITCDMYRFFNYYGNIPTLTKPTRLAVSDTQAFGKFKEKIDNLLLNNIPVYITDEGLLSYDRDGEFRTFLSNNYEGEFIGQKVLEDWHRGAIMRYKPSNKVYRIRFKSTEH